MLEELERLKSQLKELLYENAGELRRTRELLLDNERKIEARFAKLDSFQTLREEIGKKFRKRIPLAHQAARRTTAVLGRSDKTGQSGMVPRNGAATFSSRPELLEVDNAIAAANVSPRYQTRKGSARGALNFKP